MEEELKKLNIIAMGRRIRVIRESKNITKEELAEQMGITAAFISDVEYGNKSLSIKNLYMLSQILGVTAEYLLRGNLYPLDKEQKSMDVKEEIISDLKHCTPEQIKAFRNISEIFADDIKKRQKE